MVPKNEFATTLWWEMGSMADAPPFKRTIRPKPADCARVFSFDHSATLWWKKKKNKTPLLVSKAKTLHVRPGLSPSELDGDAHIWGLTYEPLRAPQNMGILTSNDRPKESLAS